MNVFPNYVLEKNAPYLSHCTCDPPNNSLFRMFYALSHPFLPPTYLLCLLHPRVLFGFYRLECPFLLTPLYPSRSNSDVPSITLSCILILHFRCCCYCLCPSLECKLHEDREFILFSLFPQHHLTHRGHS